MLKKNMILEVGNDYLAKHDFTRKFLKLGLHSNEYTRELLKDLHIDIKRRRTYIIVEEEEMTIKLLTLPKVNSKSLHDLIKSELLYYFKDLDSIIFTYTILNEEKDSLDVVVFCINEDKINFIEKHISSSSKIRGVYLIQFCILNYYKARIKDKNFVFIFAYKDNLYLLYCYNNQILNNSVFKITYDKQRFENLLYNFIESSRIYNNSSIDKIYFANYSNTQLENENLKKFCCEDLGVIDDSSLINSMRFKRR